jgi:hypothetical protein
MTSHTATGHQLVARSRHVGLSDRRRRLLDTVVGRFARDHHVMDVAHATAPLIRTKRAFLQLGNGGAPYVTHTTLHAPDQLIHDQPTVPR